MRTDLKFKLSLRDNQLATASLIDAYYIGDDTRQVKNGIMLNSKRLNFKIKNVY